MESVGFEESAGGGSRSSTVAWLYINSLPLQSLGQGIQTPRYLSAHGEVVVAWEGLRPFAWTMEAIANEAAAQLCLRDHRCIF